MIRTLDARELGADEVVRRLARPPAALDPSIQRVVDEILADVRARGDAAVLEYTERFDGHAAPSASALAIAPAEWDAADRALASDVKAALAYAAERIERYHAAALPKSWRITDEHGSVLGQEIRPLDRVGVYIPGGRASYPSRTGTGDPSARPCRRLHPGWSRVLPVHGAHDGGAGTCRRRSRHRPGHSARA